MSPRNHSFYRNGNFCKGTAVEKIISGAKVAVRCHKKFHWFFSYVCNPKFAAFWCFAAGQYVNGFFFANIDVFSICLHRSLEHI